MPEQEKYYDPDRGRDLRFAPEGKRRSYVPSRLWDQHHEILRLKVLGFKGREIAKTLDCSEQTVSNVVNSPVGKQRIKELQSTRDVRTMDIHAEVKKAAPEAFMLLMNVIKGEDAGADANIALRARTAENMLDRTVPKKTISENLHGHFTLEQIEDFKNRARNNIAAEKERQSA